MFLEYLFSPELQKEFTELRQCPSAFKDVDADWGPMKSDVERRAAKFAYCGLVRFAHRLRPGRHRPHDPGSVQRQIRHRCRVCG